MDAPSYRTLHMRHLVAQAGGPAGWIRKHAGTRWQQAQVSQWISESNPKGIGHKLARDLEVAMGLPHGYLDQPGDELENTPVARQPATHGNTAVVADPEASPQTVPAGDPTDVFMGALELLPQGEREAAASILAQLARTPDSQPMRDALKAIVSSPRKDKHDPVG